MQALTLLKEDEIFFQQEIAKFAQQQIAPKVIEMDEKQSLNNIGCIDNNSLSK